MKNKFSILALSLACSVFLFSSCGEDEIPNEEEQQSTVSYIINYGSFSGDKSTISAFDKETDLVTNGYYKSVNGVDIVSNVQHATNFNDKIYLMGNNSDQVFWVDYKTFVQTENAITEDIVKPRFSVGNGNYLYVSCWGGDIWMDETLSYIAKINLTTNAVEEKIILHGGPEGLAIANGKLYAALNYKDSVAVINLSNGAISYIETHATSSYFLKDNTNNLYISFVSYDPTVLTGLGYINTSADVLEATYELAGISSSYVNIMVADTDFSKIYIVEEGANWGDPGALGIFDIASKSFEPNKFIDDVAGLNGVAFNDDKVFCFIAEGVTGNGIVRIYNTDGTFIKEHETGIAPFMLLTVE